MNRSKRFLTKPQASFLHDLTDNQTNPIEVAGTTNGALCATITSAHTIRLEVFDRKLRDHAGIQVTSTGLRELISSLQQLAATIRDTDGLQSPEYTV